MQSLPKEITTHILSKLPSVQCLIDLKRTLLQCRLVCKQWTPKCTEMLFHHWYRMTRDILLKNRNLTRLPIQFGSLNKRLLHLDLSFNSFDHLPACVCKLTKLKSLNLEHNKISRLPESISNLRSLEILKISSNPISELSFKTTRNLKHIYAYNTLITTIPRGIYWTLVLRIGLV